MPTRMGENRLSYHPPYSLFEVLHYWKSSNFFFSKELSLLTNLFEVFFPPEVHSYNNILLLSILDSLSKEILDLIGRLGSSWVNSWRGT